MDINYNNRIYVQHEFYHDIICPDFESIARRDAFIDEANKNSPYSHEGDDLVAIIPDVELPEIRDEEIDYKYVKMSSVKMQFLEDMDRDYNVISLFNWAA